MKTILNKIISNYQCYKKHNGREKQFFSMKSVKFGNHEFFDLH